MFETIETDGEAFGFPGTFAVPAFVNAHTHLELTFQMGHADPLPEDFGAWVDQLLSAARAAGADEETYKKSYRDGLALSLAAGSATILDHSRRADYLLPESRGFPGRLVTAFEFSGFEEPLAEEYFRPAREILDKYPRAVGALSPVAPHSISAGLYRLSIRRAREQGLLLCGHLAETREELEFLARGTGPFAHYMAGYRPRDTGGWVPPGVTPIEFLNDLGGLGPRTIAAHCNYLTDRDVEILAATGAHVVHCPGSCRFFGHRSFRLRDLLDAGVNVCLGTDSLASNDSLSVLEGMRQLKREHPWLSDAEVFRMGTWNGLRAVGGGVEPAGWPGDFCIFPWSAGRAPSGFSEEAILEELLAGDRIPEAVVIGGRIAYRAGGA